MGNSIQLCICAFFIFSVVACGQNQFTLPTSSMNSGNGGTPSTGGSPNGNTGSGAGSTKCGASAMSPGIDVSSYQVNTSWPDVQKTGTSFAFIKATEGVSYTNIDFSKDWQQSKASGVVRSAYHFFVPTEDATQQANHFLKTMGTMAADDMPPMLDWETPPGNSAQTSIARGKLWLQLVQNATGRIPIIYTSAGIWNALGNPIGFETFPLFVVDIINKCPKLPPTWKNWTFWQFTVGTLKGVNGSVDMDVFNGTTSQLGNLSLDFVSELASY